MIEIKHKITDKVLCRIDSNMLINAYLPGADLSGANLSGADLSGANLSFSNLSCAGLSGANLSKANLSGTIGNGKEIKSIIHMDRVVWTDKKLWIACVTGSIDDWRNGNVKLSRDDRKKWDKYRDALLMLIDAD